MIGYRVGLLITLGIVLSFLAPQAPQAQAPTPPSSQAPPASSLKMELKTTHSVKVGLADTEKGCVVQKVSPEAIGIYPGDSLVWNVENACSAEAKLKIEAKDKSLPVKELPPGAEVISALPSRRALVTMQAIDELPDGVPFICGPFKCSVNGVPQEFCDKLPPLCICRRPPCPPSP
jgi:hypothetical protein